MTASNDTLSHPANFMLPKRASLFYAAYCKAGVAIADVNKSAEFLLECGRTKKCFSSQNSKPNELII